MRAITIKPLTKILGILLLVAIATLVFLYLVQAIQDTFVSVGWHDLVSVGWVKAAM